MRLFLIALALIFSIPASAASHGNPWVNAASPIGGNMSEQESSGNGSIPFLNIFKTGGDWWTGFSPGFGTHANEEAYLYANCLDANLYASTTACPNGTFTASSSGSTTMVVSALGSGPGPWLGGTISGTGVSGTPTITACPAGGCGTTGNYTLSSSQTFSGSVTESLTATLLWVALNYATPTPYLYPSGNYTISFSGVGPVSVTGDGTVTCSTSPCTFSVTPSSSGMTVVVPIPGPDAVSNIRLYLTANASLLPANDCTPQAGKSFFDPTFLAKWANFSTVRFMQAFDTYTNLSVNWSDRAQCSYAFWNTGDNNGSIVGGKGWPYEVAAEFCNEINADCWPNEPCISSEPYAASMAALFASLLKPNLKVYVEYCNEVMFAAQSATIVSTMEMRGFAAFPSAGSNLNAIYMYALQRAIDDGAAWKTAFGSNSGQVVRVFGGQAGCDGCYQQVQLGLSAPIYGGGSWTGIAATHFDALATAPYYTAIVPSADTADADGGLTAYFCINGAIGSPCHGQVPSGAGAVTTGGTSTAYTLADGAGSGCPAGVAVNEYVTSAIFHTTNGASPTLAVDGCPAEPILCDGGPIQILNGGTVVCNPGDVGVVPPTASFGTGSGNPYLLAYTTTTANGTVTTSWRILCVGLNCLGQTIQQAVGFIANNIADVATFNAMPGVNMTNILYEGGVQNISTTQAATDVWYNLFNAVAHDARQYQATDILMQGLRATTGFGGPFVYYVPISPSGVTNRGQNYGLLESTYQTTAPKWQGALDFNRRNPCWWSGCRH